MNDLNTLVVSGRLTKDVVSRNVGDHVVSESSLAVNRKFGEKESVVFLDFVAWDKQGESMAKLLKKGSSVYLTARLQQDTWESKDDGGKRSKLLAVVENWQFLPFGPPKKENLETDGASEAEEKLPF